MVNIAAVLFSSTIDKTAKKRHVTDARPLARSLPKEGHGGQGMKKGLLSIFCLLVLSLTALPVGAQTRTRRFDNYRRYEQRVADSRYRNEVYRDRRDRNSDYWDRDNSVWDRHRDKITTAAGAGGGAVIGGLIGGTKGAIIGAIAGGGGAALYTYKIRDDRRRRY
jgi:hypothetical protein